MAKGVEDTAFYCYNRLIALNEVGADPGRNDGTSVADFHAYNARMQATHPMTMTTLSTHDTKRSRRRARAPRRALTEIPREFLQALRRWSRMNAKLRSGSFPDRNTEYFYYQTLIGAWPITPDRLQDLHAEGDPRGQAANLLDRQQQGPFEDALNSFIDATLARQGLPLGPRTDRRPDHAMPAGSTPSPRRCSSTPPRVCPTSTRAPNSGTSASSIRITAGPSTTISAARFYAETPGTPIASHPRAHPTRVFPSCGPSTRALHLRKRAPGLVRPGRGLSPAARESPAAAASTSLRMHFLVAASGRHRRPQALAHAQRPVGPTDTSVTLPEGDWVNRLTGAQFPGGVTLASRPLLQQLLQLHF